MKRLIYLLTLPFALQVSTETHNNHLFQYGKLITDCDIFVKKQECNDVTQTAFNVGNAMYQRGKLDAANEIERMLDGKR